jgi:hypothetical protein
MTVLPDHQDERRTGGSEINAADGVDDLSDAIDRRTRRRSNRCRSAPPQCKPADQDAQDDHGAMQGYAGPILDYVRSTFKLGRDLGRLKLYIPADR